MSPSSLAASPPSERILAGQGAHELGLRGELGPAGGRRRDRRGPEAVGGLPARAAGALGDRPEPPEPGGPDAEGAAELSEDGELPAARRVDGGLEGGVRLEEHRAQPVGRLGARAHREVALRG